jgi:hypothetical protein
LFEEFTSNSSPSCANNNAFLNAFVNNNFDNVCAIKYHLGILGVDSFYISNPIDSDARRRYYYAGAVPLTIADGKTFVTIPYGDSTNLYTPYYSRLRRGTPLQMTVTEEVVTPGVRRATATVNVLSAMRPGQYKLRFNAVERYKNATQQGTNGETNFYDIFRDVYPDTNGILISTSPGTNQYSVTYNVDPIWQDSMIYTVAYVQNDADREIINCDKSRSNVSVAVYDKPQNVSRKADLFNAAGNSVRSTITGSDTIQSNLTAELFEAFFPPIGWRVFNQDGFISFDQYSGANGPSIGGTRSVIMDFYDYNIIGQRDSMYSASYIDLYISDTLRFDYAYAQYNTSNIDSLIVRVSVDGGLTFPFEVFRRGGLNLATAPQTSSFFVPQNNTEWRSFSFPLSSVVSASSGASQVPSAFGLRQNYPNPFNPSTTVNFSLPINSHVKMVVHNILGKEIKTLTNDLYNAGEHSIVFQANDLPSGIYFCTIITPGFTSTIRMILIR